MIPIGSPVRTRLHNLTGILCGYYDLQGRQMAHVRTADGRLRKVAAAQLVRIPAERKPPKRKGPPPAVSPEIERLARCNGLSVEQTLEALEAR